MIRDDSEFNGSQAETHALKCEGWGTLSQGLDSAIIQSCAYAVYLFGAAELEGDVDDRF